MFTLRDGKVARFESFHDTAAGERAFRPDLPGHAAGVPMHH
jgi:ketosteroid isomerase-like protein